jgi:hypothetical protein
VFPIRDSHKHRVWQHACRCDRKYHRPNGTQSHVYRGS